MSGAGNENAANDNNANNIIFTIKDTKLNVCAVTFTTKENRKLSKLSSKGFERSVYWNEYKAKNENKNKANECRYISKSNFVGANRLFASVYSNQDGNSKRFIYQNI